jgi:hypothetical protein
MKLLSERQETELEFILLLNLILFPSASRTPSFLPQCRIVGLICNYPRDYSIEVSVSNVNDKQNLHNMSVTKCGVSCKHKVPTDLLKVASGTITVQYREPVISLKNTASLL